MSRPAKRPLVRRFRKRNRLITLLFLLTAISFSAVFLAKCRVRSVTILGTEQIPDVAVLDAAGLSYGTHLFALDIDKIEAQIVASNPYIRRAAVKRHLLTRIEIEVEEYTPRYALETEDGYVLLSEELVVLERTDEQDAMRRAPILLSLPAVEATLGKSLVFSEKESETACRQILNVFSESALADRLSALDLSEPFDICAALDNGKYRFLCGSSESLAEKLAHCGTSLRYLENHMRHVTGVLRAEGSASVSFFATGVAE